MLPCWIYEKGRHADKSGTNSNNMHEFTFALLTLRKNQTSENLVTVRRAYQKMKSADAKRAFVEQFVDTKRY